MANLLVVSTCPGFITMLTITGARQMLKLKNLKRKMAWYG
jgi:hypothetical protein